MQVINLVADAYRLARVIGDDEEPDGTQVRTGVTVLGDLLADWQSEVSLNWLHTNAWFKLRPGERLYTLGPDGDFGERVVELFNLNVEVGHHTPIPIRLTDSADFNRRPQNTRGRPILAHLEEGAESSVLYFWPTPVSEGLIRFSFQREVDDVDVLGKVDVPKEWRRAVKYNLAKELCPRYGLPVEDVVAEIAMTAYERQRDNGLDGGEFVVTPPAGY